MAEPIQRTMASASSNGGPLGSLPLGGPSESILLRDTVTELGEILERERAYCRKQVQKLQQAKELLKKQGIDVDEEEADEIIPRAPSIDFRGLKHPSFIKQGMGKHFEAMANVLKDLKATSETTIRIKNLTFQNKVYQGQKSFPTVFEALASPLIRCLSRHKKPRDINVLNNITTVLQPAKCYLVLGPPKSGKTSLLKAVAGRLHVPKGASLTGEITYNGDKATSGRFDITSLARFVEQLDIHEPFLSVRETFNFAGRCTYSTLTQGYWNTRLGLEMMDHLGFPPILKEDLKEGRNLNHPKVREALAKNRTRVNLSLLGLKRCANTIVGNEKVRGVSGGERRRVTLGEMLTSNYSVGCFDEISTGLDSAATYDIINMLKSITKAFKYTTLISLLQPPPEVFDLFDEVLVMSKGYLVYQGPTDRVVPYMAKLGYPCPSGKDIADFLVEVHSPGSTDFFLLPPEQRQASNNIIVNPPPRTPKEFQAYFQYTLMWADKMLILNDSTSIRGAYRWQMPEILPYANDWIASFKLCIAREWLFFRRDKAYLMTNLLQNSIIGALLGTIYFQIGPDQTMDRFGATYALLSSIAFKGGALIPVFFSHRAVFYKQHNARFYHPSAYALASLSVTSLYVVIDTLTLGVLMYFLAGFSLTDNGLPFFRALAILITGGTAMQQFFRTLTWFTPDQKATLSYMGLILLFFLLFSGYITTTDNVPKYLIWCIYSNPLFYLFQGLAVNEFRSSRYGEDGVNHLKALGLYTQEYWSWLSIVIGLAILALYFVLGLIAMVTIEHRPRTNLAASSASLRKDVDEGKGKKGETNGTTTVEKKQPDGSIAIEMMPSNGDSSKPTEGEAAYNSAINQATVNRGIQLTNDPAKETAGGGGPAVVKPQISYSTSSLPWPASKGILPQKSYAASGLPFNPTTLAFRDLVYTVALPSGESIDLIKGIDGYFKPGTMTALMGSSGAGKTTLLDVIAGRKTSGIIKGDLYVNGAPINMKTYPRIIGYVEQMDLHSPLTTVYEALEFSARLRLSSCIPRAAQDEFVQEVMGLLELGPIKDDIVGSRAEGLSTEQKKRLTIGVELVANPSLIFLDEPTSGLDSRAASVVIRVVKKLSLTGRTIICTIHQPSLAIFQQFDSLYLLKRGGETVFFGLLGYNSCNLIDYLQSIPGTPSITEGENPATWMLNCIGAGTGTEQQTLDYASEYRNSALAILCKDELRKLIPTDLEGKADLVDFDETNYEPARPPQQGKYDEDDETDSDVEIENPISRYRAPSIKRAPAPLTSANWWTAAQMCIKRTFKAYNRMPSYNGVRLVLCFAIAISFALVFGPQKQSDFKGLYGFVAVLYLSTAFIGRLDAGPVIEILFTEKPSFARERFTSMYPVGAYALSWAIAEVPWIALQSLIFAVPFYFLCGFGSDDPDPAKFFFFLMYHFLYNLWNAYFGQLLAMASPTGQVAQVFNSTVGTLLSNFMGFTRNPKNIPSYLKFLYWALPGHYALEGMVATQWHNSKKRTTYINTSDGSVSVITASQAIDQFFEQTFHYENRWINVAVLVGFCCLNVLLLTLVLKFIRIGSR